MPVFTLFDVQFIWILSLPVYSNFCRVLLYGYFGLLCFPSHTIPHNMLCQYRHENIVKHIKILYINGLFRVEDKSFPSIERLVKYYGKKEIENKKGVKGVRLLYPIKRESQRYRFPEPLPQNQPPDPHQQLNTYSSVGPCQCPVCCPNNPPLTPWFPSYYAWSSFKPFSSFCSVSFYCICLYILWNICHRKFI